MEIISDYSSSKGFTLIEVMAVLVILGVAIIPLLGYFSNSIGFVHQTEIRSQALSLGGSVLEEVKQEAAADWDYLDDINPDQEYNIDDLTANYELLTDYTVKVEPTSFDFNGDGDADADDDEIGREIEVEVNWNNGQKNIEISTLIRKR